MASLGKRAAAGNRSRDGKWAAVMENKAMLAGAAQTAANAKKQQAMQAITLQNMRNTGQMDQMQQRGANQLATTAAVGQNRLAQIGATGEENRKNTMLSLTQGHKNAMEASAQDNIYAKEKDNRAFITSAMSRGATMDETAQNAYNTPGAFDPDINGITIPGKQQKQQNPIYVKPQFDKNDVLRPGTDKWVQPPGSQAQQAGLGGSVGLSPDFNPAEPSPADEAILRQLHATGQFDLLRQIEEQYGLSGQ